MRYASKSASLHLAPYIALASALLLSGCLKTPHFHLEVPERDAPLQERAAAYEELAPRIIRGTEVTNYDSIGGRHLEYVDSMELANGNTIFSPEVLRQAILPDSETSRLIDSYVDARRRNHRIRWVGRGIGLTAIPFLVGAIVTDSDTAQTALGAAALGTFVTWIVMRLVARSQGQRRERLQGLVFYSFDDALLNRLALCPSDDGVARTCEVPPAPTGVHLRAIP